jgi:NTE family protein
MVETSPAALAGLPTEVVALPPDGLVKPRDFGAGYGDGLGLGVSLGGGGLFFVAWQAAYLATLAERGVHLAGSDRMVGTSAGSLVAAVVEAGNLKRLRTEVGLLSKVPKLIGMLAPAGDLHPSQERARDLFFLAEDSDPETLRSIGHATLAAQTPGEGTMPRSVALVLVSRRWPSAALHVTCVDAYTGERCVVTQGAGVPITKAVAASSAVPGLFAAQPIGDRRCMDGGVSGSGTHLDLLAGAAHAVVLCLTDGNGAESGAMTSSPNAFLDEVEALEGVGTKVFHRIPEEVDLLRLMEPETVPEAIAMGERQAAADAEELRTFLAGTAAT